MVNPKEVWMFEPNGTLCTKSLGSRLDVQLSARIGFFSFAVSRRPDGAGGASCVLVEGERPSAMQAMAAAELAAADLSCKLPWRQLPEQHFPPISEGAAHQRPALDGPSSSLGSRAVRGGFGPLKDSSALWHG